MRLFFTLVIPVTILIAALLTLYFTVQYSFSQAMSLGVLYGLFSGVIVTIMLSIALLLLRGGTANSQNKLQKSQKDIASTGKKEDSKEKKELIQTEVIPVQKKINKSVNKNVKKDMEHKLMLLMNKELTFELMITTLKDQFSLTTQNINTGTIDVKTNDGIISISIVSLTKHTSQVTINSISNSKYIQNIVSFLKEKEHSFLQY